MFKRYIVLLFFVLSLPASFDNSAVAKAMADRHHTFSQWYDACNNALDSDTSETIVSAEQFKHTIKQFLRVAHNQITDTKAWLNTNKIHKELPDAFIPYVQKLHLPAQSIAAFHGDLHGNVHALNSYLASLAHKGYLDKQNPFRIIKDNFYLIFLGDYVDRGDFGVETIYTILRLKIENPDHVFMVRGNHEDLHLNERYGFVNELTQKFGNAADATMIELLQKVYNSLPVALYLGLGKPQARDYILCCHGGWEVGYDPVDFLKSRSSVKYHAFDTLERKSMLAKLSHSVRHELHDNLPRHEYATNMKIDGPTTPVHLGFLWHDFMCDSGASTIEYHEGRGWKLGKPLIEDLRTRLDEHDIHLRAIFRAHQHADKPLFSMMLEDGIAKLWEPKHIFKNGLWDGIVCTFLVAPHTGYGNSFDAWGELKVGESFASSYLATYKNYTDVGE